MEQNGNIKPSKYNHGKIYKLVDSSGFYYVGSTCTSLSKRLSGHKAMSKTKTERKLYKHIMDWDEIRIVLIEEVNVENKEQLTKEEDKFINRNDPFCLNVRNALQTEEQRKNYLIEQRSEIIKCICGSEITKSHFARHQLAQRHQEFVKHAEQENISL